MVLEVAVVVEREVVDVSVPVEEGVVVAVVEVIVVVFDVLVMGEVVVVVFEVVVMGEVVAVVMVFEVVVVVLVLLLVASSASVKTRFVSPCSVKVVVPLWGTTTFLAKVPMLAP